MNFHGEPGRHGSDKWVVRCTISYEECPESKTCERCPTTVYLPKGSLEDIRLSWIPFADRIWEAHMEHDLCIMAIERRPHVEFYLLRYDLRVKAPTWREAWEKLLDALKSKVNEVVIVEQAIRLVTVTET